LENRTIGVGIFIKSDLLSTRHFVSEENRIGININNWCHNFWSKAFCLIGKQNWYQHQLLAAEHLVEVTYYQSDILSPKVTE
jgi:hypothetical protein